MTSSFTGWPPHLFSWFADLEQNNNKPWFTEHRAGFDEINAASKLFANELEERLASAGINGEGKVWRIHRDQRFSKGEPYKTTHDLGLFDETGALHGLRIEPHGVTLAYGLLPFSKTQLEKYREAIAEPAAATDLDKVLAKVDKAGFGLGEPDLKRPLKTLPDDHPHPDLSRYKGLFVTKYVEGQPSWIFKAGALSHVEKELAKTRPLQAWLADTVG